MIALAILLGATPSFAAPDLGPVKVSTRVPNRSKLKDAFGIYTNLTRRDDPRGRLTSGLEEHAFGFVYKTRDNTRSRNVLRVTDTFFAPGGKVLKVVTLFQRFTEKHLFERTVTEQGGRVTSIEYRTTTLETVGPWYKETTYRTHDLREDGTPWRILEVRLEAAERVGREATYLRRDGSVWLRIRRDGEGNLEDVRYH